MVVKKLLFMSKLLVCLIFLTGCQADISKPVVYPRENLPVPEVYFCQVDNCSDHLIGLINSADESIFCAFFDLDLKNVISSLEDKSKELQVRIVIDNENFQEQLPPQILRKDTSSQYSHNKFCVFDEKVVFTGSFNPTERGNAENDNNIVIINSRYISSNYRDEFDELWQGIFGKGKNVSNPVVYLNTTRVENYFCPEDMCAERIIQNIGQAKESIHFMTFSFTHEGIADSILFKDIVIKGIFEKIQAGSRYSQYDRFKDFGLEVKKDTNPANMHHKVFIIDKKIVVTGSFNPSQNADRENDENILIIHNAEIAQRYLDEFERVWQ